MKIKSAIFSFGVTLSAFLGANGNAHALAPCEACQMLYDACVAGGETGPNCVIYVFSRVGCHGCSIEQFSRQDSLVKVDLFDKAYSKFSRDFVVIPGEIHNAS